jgi:two-component system chemotaxis sensor kinase CheA
MDNERQEKDEMQEIIEEFIAESSELMEKVIQDIVTIEKSPDPEVVNSIFRAVHTVKGTSSFLGFGLLSSLAHKAEDVFGMIRKGELIPDGAIADTLLEAVDLMKAMIEDIRDKGAEDRDSAPVLRKLEAIAKMDVKKIGDILIEEKVLTSNERDGILKKQEAEKEKKFGEIVVEEKLITEGQLQGLLSKQKTQREDQTIRIDVNKLDELMNLVGELVLGKNRLILMSSMVKKGSENEENVLDGLSDLTNYIEAVTNELQLSVMKARLVPISKLLNKVPRLIRDLCGEFKKEIDLKIEGEETELDRSLIEALHDPLVHVIRNSVDHGVETPDHRVAHQKARRGQLSIKAFNEGNQVIIEIFDDGKGINIQAVKDKVKEKGIMSEPELNALSPKEVMNLIFIPGLSTAKKVSSVSGRGVGMDVVKTNIEKMNGQVYVDSEEGKWTRLTVRLPLTLAIMRSLIVKVAQDLFAMPLNTVLELVKMKPGLTKTVERSQVIVLRERVIPIVDLSRVFIGQQELREDGYLVICSINEKIVGIRVDSVVGQEEVVIKPLGEFLGNISGIGGATIRGDGKAILILDIPTIIETSGGQKKSGNSSRAVA